MWHIFVHPWSEEVVRLLRCDCARQGIALLPQIPVRRPEHLETTSLGAAFAAGIATGFWSKEWVLGSGSEQEIRGDYTDFLPQVPVVPQLMLSSLLLF